jgi:hypothetical protein
MALLRVSVEENTLAKAHSHFGILREVADLRHPLHVKMNADDPQSDVRLLTRDGGNGNKGCSDVYAGYITHGLAGKSIDLITDGVPACSENLVAMLTKGFCNFCYFYDMTSALVLELKVFLLVIN